ELGADADVAVIDFAVVSDVANDAGGPILAEAQLLAISALGANKPHDIWFLGFERFIDVPRANSELFAVDHRLERPFHYQQPLIILLTYDRCERLLRNDIRQNDVIVRPRELQ